MSQLFVLKMGASFPRIVRAWGDFEDWIVGQVAWSPEQISVIDARSEPPLPAVNACAGVIMTGSHCMVTDHERWSERVAEWIPTMVQARVPMLGICYGHQLLAYAMGGKVGPNPAGPQFGTVEMSIHAAATKDPLFKDSLGKWPVQTSHFQSVLRLPPGAHCLASTDQDSHHAFAIGGHAWGVQFHPEYRVNVAQAYIHECSEALADSGMDDARLSQAVIDTPVARSLLRRFCELLPDAKKRAGETLK